MGNIKSKNKTVIAPTLFFNKSCLTEFGGSRINIAGIPRMSSVTIFQSDHFVLSTNFLFKFNVSLPLVTGELLQNTVDVNNVTYKLYDIKALIFSV